MRSLTATSQVDGSVSVDVESGSPSSSSAAAAGAVRSEPVAVGRSQKQTQQQQQRASVPAERMSSGLSTSSATSSSLFGSAQGAFGGGDGDGDDDDDHTHDFGRWTERRVNQMPLPGGGAVTGQRVDAKRMVTSTRGSTRHASTVTLDGGTRGEREMTMASVVGMGVERERKSKKYRKANWREWARELLFPRAANRLLMFGGVYVPACMSTFGPTLFLRASFVIGEAGTFEYLAMLGLIAILGALLISSMSALLTNGNVRSGGPYFLLSRTLGPQLGGAIGVLLILEHIVAGAFYVTGLSTYILSTCIGLCI